MKSTRLFCVLLAAAMLLSLAACGKDDRKSPIRSRSGTMRCSTRGQHYGGLRWKRRAGPDAGFYQQQQGQRLYVWSISETAIQNGAELAIATVFANSDSYDTVIDSQLTDVAPGETLELRTAFVLADTTSKVEVTFEGGIRRQNR